MQFVSVVIPVFKNLDGLARCLSALAEQTYPHDQYEIIIVDNGGNEGCESLITKLTNVRLIEERKPGSYAARNSGVKVARGKVIAFTDSDCIPAHDWLEKGVRKLTSIAKCGLVLGQVDVLFARPARPTPYELYDSVTSFPQDFTLRKFKAGVTANIFTFKEVFDRVGLFNDTFKSMGDLEWGYRVFCHGYEQVIADDARVAHPARSTFCEIYQKSLRQAGGYFMLAQRGNKDRRQKKLRALRLLAQNLIPPVFYWLTMLREKRLRVGERVKVCWVILLVRYIMGAEILRLCFGGSVRR